MVVREEPESAGQRHLHCYPLRLQEASKQTLSGCLRSATTLPHREIQGQEIAQGDGNALMASAQQLNFREIRARSGVGCQYSV